jgi:hypothetical protein
LVASAACVTTVAVAPIPAAAAPGDQSGRIAYVVDAGMNNAQIWVANADGSNAHMVRDGVRGDANPQWHPAGGLLAFEQQTAEGYRQLLGRPRIVKTLDPNTGGVTNVTQLPEKETRVEPCVPAEPGCSITLEDYDVRDDKLIDWAPDGQGMLVRRSFYPAFEDVSVIDRSWLRITGAGGALTDAGREITFPGADNQFTGEGCEQESIDSSLPEIGDVHFLPSVESDRFAVLYGNDCNFDGTPQFQWKLDGAPFAATFPVDPEGHGTGINTISPDGRITVHGPGGLWETTAAGSPTVPLTAPTTTPFPANVAWFPDPGCYGTFPSTIGKASWSSDRSFLVFDAMATPGVPNGWPEPYRSQGCEPGDVAEDEDGIGVSGIWKVNPTERIPRLLIRGGYAPDVECKVGSCLTLLKIVTTAANLDMEDDPQFTYSGAVNGTTGAVTPLGTGGVLSARVGSGAQTVVAAGAPNYVLDSVQCSAPSSRSGAQVTVQVVADSTTTCTFHYVNGDPDPCLLNPEACETDGDGDGRSDADEGPPGTDTDGDGTPDAQDPDSDDDGIPDANEGDGDADGDTIPDWRDPSGGGGPCDGKFTSSIVEAQTAFDTEMTLDVGVRWCTDGEEVEVANQPAAVQPSVFVWTDTVLQQALAQLAITLRADGEPEEDVTALANGATRVVVSPRVKACVDTGDLLTKFGGKLGRYALDKVWLKAGAAKRAELVEKFIGTGRSLSEKLIKKLVDDVAARATSRQLMLELFDQLENLAVEMVEDGIGAVLDRIPDICVTTWAGDLRLTLFPSGTVVDIWDRTSGASWIIEQETETSG